MYWYPELVMVSTDPKIGSGVWLDLLRFLRDWFLRICSGLEPSTIVSGASSREGLSESSGEQGPLHITLLQAVVAVGSAVLLGPGVPGLHVLVLVIVLPVLHHRTLLLLLSAVGLLDGNPELLEADDPDEPADGRDVSVVDPQHAEESVDLQQVGFLHQLERGRVNLHNKGRYKLNG